MYKMVWGGRVGEIMGNPEGKRSHLLKLTFVCGYFNGIRWKYPCRIRRF